MTSMMAGVGGALARAASRTSAWRHQLVALSRSGAACAEGPPSGGSAQPVTPDFVTPVNVADIKVRHMQA
jgi:hypothetical protein